MEIKKSNKLVKCQMCNLKDEYGINMEVVKPTESSPNKYFHKNCYKQYLEDKEFKAKELVEMDKLYETIKKIHGVEMLSNYCFVLLQSVRNGTYGINKMNKNYYTYKKGYSYSTIEEAYLMCADSIMWSKANKSFRDFNNEFSYGIAIVSGNLQQAQDRIEQREKSKIAVQGQLDKANEFSVDDLEEEELFESSYKKTTKNKINILDFLD
jgi:hypothetical protein